MLDEGLIAEITDFANQKRTSDGPICTDVDGLFVMCDEAPSTTEACLYDPVICLVIQGRKETHLGNHCIEFGAGESLIVTHTVPVVAAVTEASAEKPYISIILRLEVGTLQSLIRDIGEIARGDDQLCVMQANQSDAELTEAIVRLFRISQDPVDREALAPLTAREVHYRALRASHGKMLRQLVLRDSSASRVAKAIARIRSDYKQQIQIRDLASIAGMSLSAFHQHFKQLTTKSPLQYQKELRLIEARRMLLGGDMSVSNAAFGVGYESLSQFSREYSRMFGASPRNDVPPSAVRAHRRVYS